MRIQTIISLSLLAILGLASLADAPSSSAFAQPGASVQAQTFRTALTPAEQALYAQTVKQEQKQLELHLTNLVRSGNPISQVDVFAKSNERSVAVLTKALDERVGAMRASKAAATANPAADAQKRRSFVIMLAQRDVKQSIIPSIPAIRGVAAKQDADLKKLAAAKAAAAAAPPPVVTVKTPAWLTSLPGYRAEDATAYARCSTETARCNSGCTQSSPSAQANCQKFCVTKDNTCTEHIRWTTYNRPLNSSNPLTRLYDRREDIYGDPNYARANNAWRACLYSRDGSTSNSEDIGRCQRLSPDNAIRQ